MFIKAYRYFKSIGFPSLPKTFWTNSHFARVWSRDMICNPPAALDMRDGSDFRVKSCAQLGMPDFELAHSLMAQVYYQYLYRQQPLLFREPASSSISDAIARVFAHLSTNPHYLYSQKLVTASHLDIKDSLIVNKLYKEALENFVKMPFDIVADNWRFEQFEGKITPAKINDRWWELRTKYEGISAPEPYNSSNLDALMHTAISQVHSPAIKSLISYVVQFQILKSICPTGTVLSEGCILSEVTTEKLREVMKKGSSITWLQALEQLTGSAQLDASPLLEYYEPLADWLRNTNEIDQTVLGWDGDGTPFSADEIPKPRAGMDSGSGILSEDRVAFPGGLCANGQECLLDSHCNGTICVCNEGLYTLEIGATVNCVPGNPADSGFGDGKGGLVIGLFSSETTPNPEPEPTTSSQPSSQRPVSLTSTYLIIPSLLFATLVYLL
nr:Peptidase M2 domain containing protein [Haemonchus contortus]